MKKIFKSKEGFTLLELAVTMTILSIILLFTFKVLNFNIGLLRTEDAAVEYSQNIRLAASHIMKTLRQSDTEDESDGILSVNAAKIITSNNIVLMDAEKNLSNPGNAKLWLYFESNKFGLGKDYGELRNQNGDILAVNLRNIIVSDTGSTIRIGLTAGREKNEASLTLVYRKQR